MNSALKAKLEAHHELAKLEGLNVRFWDAQHTALVIALPDEAAPPPAPSPEPAASLTPAPEP